MTPSLEKLVNSFASLPGIGRKTANLILGDIYHKPAIVCDTHCIRITNRLSLSTSKDPLKCEIQLREILPPELGAVIHLLRKENLLSPQVLKTIQSTSKEIYP